MGINNINAQKRVPQYVNTDIEVVINALTKGLKKLPQVLILYVMSCGFHYNLDRLIKTRNIML